MRKPQRKQKLRKVANRAGKTRKKKFQKPTAKTWRTCVLPCNASSWNDLAIEPKIAKLASPTQNAMNATM